MRMDNERGMALAVAIFALVIVGALVAGAFFIGLQEQRVGRNSLGNLQASQAAEAGGEIQLATWNANAMVYNLMPVGSLVTFTDWLPDGSGWYRGRVRRMSSLMYFIETEGFSRDSASRHHLGILARLRPIEINIRAGLETRGRIEFAGNATVSGIDTVGGMTGCPVPSDTLSGLRIADADSVDGQGNNWEVLGPPGDEIEEDPTITDSSMTNFGELEFDDLELWATIVLPGNTNGSAYRVEPSTSGGACDLSDDMNWGEPEGIVPECSNYYPIIFVRGDLHLNQRRAQGVIIVDGNLYVRGLTKLYGPVIVRGTLIAEGGGMNVPHFFGGVIAADDVNTADSSRVAGNAQIYYSSCAIERAMSLGAPAFRLDERSWVNLY